MIDNSSYLQEAILRFHYFLYKKISMAVITSAAFSRCSTELENELPHLLDVAAVAVTLSPQKWREVTGGHPFTSCLLGAGVCMHRQPALNLLG